MTDPHPTDDLTSEDAAFEARDRRLRTVQGVSLLVAIGAALGGFLASLEVRLLPLLSAAGVWIAFVVLLAWAVASAFAAVERGRAVDRRRWRAVDDPAMSSAERELAHQEAERERRFATTAWFAAPIAMGYWLGYQVAPGLELALPPAGLFTLAPLAGYLVGLFVAHRLAEARDRPDVL